MSEHTELSTEAGLNQTTLVLKQVTADVITVEYNLLPDTNPGSYSNYIAIWQNYDNIPYNQAPTDPPKPIEGSSQRGTVSFPVSLTQNNYIIGYSVGPELATPSQKYGNVCSTVYVPRIPTAKALTESGGHLESEPSDYFFTGLTVGAVSGDVVTVKYSIPPNCQPKTNNAYLGVFKGAAGYNLALERAVAIKNNDESAWVAITGKFLAGKRYTIAYFMSGYSDTTPVLTRMAATVPFTA
ncbi:MAG: hypothetical protein ABSD59_24270 [Terracidiphilus sp.]|jgi:hypothetical protein